MTRPCIFKFGGTSLQSTGRILDAVKLIAQFDGPLAVVTSALGGVTNRLNEACDQPEQATAIKDELRNRHLEVAGGLDLTPANIAAFEDYLDSTLADLPSAHATVDPQARDTALSIGERLSTYLVATTLQAQGLDGIYVDSRTLIRTSDDWGNAQVDFDVTEQLVKSALAAQPDGNIPVITGFLGSTAAGTTTTIGRNGSDYTASILGKCLNAAEIWIWTDVDGILTADPRYHEGARLLREISFREAAEVAFFGASVIHPHTLRPLLDTDVSVRIKNTLNPQAAGTLICAEPEGRGSILITTSIENVSVITVGGYGMVGVPGVAAAIFSAVKDVDTSVLMISQSSAEHNISFVISDSEVGRTVSSLEETLNELISKKHSIDHITVVPDVAIVTVVGSNMRGRYGIAGKIFTALGRNTINVIAIAQGSSEYSISMVINATDLRPAVDAIHGELDDE